MVVNPAMFEESGNVDFIFRQSATGLCSVRIKEDLPLSCDNRNA